MTTTKQESWFATAVGRATDPDHVGGLQCVDTAKDYAEHILDIGWKSAWPGAGNAKDMLYTYNPDYFDRILNDPNNPSLIPQRGDVIIFGGTAANGINPYGHIAVVVSATTTGVSVIQQDGFAQVPMYAGVLPYTGPGTGTCTGWLRPKLAANVTPQGPKPTPIPTKPTGGFLMALTDKQQDDLYIKVNELHRDYIQGVPGRNPDGDSFSVLRSILAAVKGKAIDEAARRKKVTGQ